jgi:glutathione synthase/RimK-type ligase-like ATP-grasp enzyme
VVSSDIPPGIGVSRVTRDDLFRRRMAGSDRSRALPRVALVSCRALPLGDEDGPALLAACVAAGLDTEWLVWDDPAVDWTSYDLVVIRSTWDYPPRRDDFVAWADAVPRLANPADVIRWNTDKTYLRDLEQAGLPVVSTTWLSPGDDVVLPRTGEYVVKPAIGAGARDTARYQPGHAEMAREHAQGMLAEGRVVMVQPYLAAVDEFGETCLLYFGGQLSHAVRKSALLTGPEPEVVGLYREEEIGPAEPSDAELKVAEQTLAAVPGGPDRLLYARVDLVPGPEGPIVLEVELTEPSFFLGDAPTAADLFASAVAGAVAPAS